MSETVGRCLCGSVSVSISLPPRDLLLRYSSSTLTCLCTSCAARSGGLASYAICLPSELVTITSATVPPDDINLPGGSAADKAGEGYHITYEEKNTTSGIPMERSFCRKCGSPVRIIEGKGDKRNTWCLQYGLFAESFAKQGLELPKPRTEMFCKRKLSWWASVGQDSKEEQ